jgi:MFS family permease
MAVQGSSPMRAGMDLLPAVCFLVPGSVVAAMLTSRFGRFRWAIWCGWGVTTLASGLFRLFDSHTSFAVFAVVLALFGAGNGMVLTGVNAATQAIASAADRAMAASVYSFMRSLGMAVGVAVGPVRVEDVSVG